MNTPKTIMIGIPAHDHRISVSLFRSLMAAYPKWAELGIGVDIQIVVGVSIVQHARNLLVDRLLKSTATHMLCIDSDISFRPKDVEMLVLADVDFVVGAAPKREIHWEHVRQAALSGVPASELARYSGSPTIRSDAEEQAIIERNGVRLVEVEAAAVSFALISRSAIERLIAALGPEHVAREARNRMAGEALATPFAVAIRDGWLFGEDIEFCMRHRDGGGKVFVAIDCELEHHGPYSFYSGPETFRTAPK